ncbi:MAG TPA: ABC transporter permease [Planctomycetota bacterium]|nr:ABC transporter permease [Planctomycetota bacterium]
MSEPEPAPDHGSLRARARRVRALVRKEAHQIARDPSSLAIGIVLPLVLILLFGYGLSLDIQDARVAVVLDEPSPDAADLAAGFELSSWFDARLTTSMAEAKELILDHQVDAIVRIPQDFARRLSRGRAPVQLLVHGTDANKARIIHSYALGTVGRFLERRAGERKVQRAGAYVESRKWFNDANDSQYFLIPGLIVLVMTLVGALLTALVVAREWERGTIESLFVTPVQPGDILLGKTIPYFALGLVGLLLSILSARFLFHVPLRGSVALLVLVSMLYLLVALALGLLISSATRNQFLASQATLTSTFMPATLLSGFMFDIRSLPGPVQVITWIVPARYFVSLLQSLFLAGDLGSVLVPNAAVLAGMAALLLLLTRGVTRKKLA